MTNQSLNHQVTLTEALFREFDLANRGLPVWMDTINRLSFSEKQRISSLAPAATPVKTKLELYRTAAAAAPYPFHKILRQRLELLTACLLESLESLRVAGSFGAIIQSFSSKKRGHSSGSETRGTVYDFINWLLFKTENREQTPYNRPDCCKAVAASL